MSSACCTIIVILLCGFITNIHAIGRAEEVEERLMAKFEQLGEVETREAIIKEIGPFREPPVKHRNYTAMTNYLHVLADQFPNLTHLYSIGTSVQGRQLWVLTISKFPRKHERGIPEFKYVANMHGNEVSGRVFLLSLAWVLLNNYRNNTWIRYLVSTTRIHLMPSMNPDGYEAAIEGDEYGIRGRSNANGKDLNRNFPQRFPEYYPVEQPQPETLAVMKWTKAIPFVLSGSLHGGITLANYPFDDHHPLKVTSDHYTPTPDNELFVRLAYSYARGHNYMYKRGPRCREEHLNEAIDPQYGIVNGANWYVVGGGMQDWNYLRTNCFELTFELTCVKFPIETQLRPLWEENKYPLMYFIKQIHRAIHGTVVDDDTGEGLENATVSIDNEMKVVTTYANGEYWRLVNLGEYKMVFNHSNYYPFTADVEITKTKWSFEFHVRLVRMPTASPSAPTKTTSETTETLLSHSTVYGIILPVAATVFSYFVVPSVF